jgi:hypothetical protein
LKFRASAAVLFLLCAPAGAETIAEGRVGAQGGELFLRDRQGRNTSWGWTSDWLGLAGATIGASDGVSAALSGQYLRRTQLTQIGGGGELTTQTLDNTLVARWLHAFDDTWTLKPSASVSNEMITLTRAERLGAGVLDFDKIAAGVELERAGPVWTSIRQTLSVYRVEYYHYEPARSPLVGLELLTDNLNLDFRALNYSASIERVAWENGQVSAAVEASWREFPRQRVVEEFEFTGRQRRDLYVGGVLGASHRFRPAGGEATAGLNAGVFRLRSTQNDFDIATVAFNPAFYDYVEYTAGPWASGRFRGGVAWSANYTAAVRVYGRRPRQDFTGAYIGGTIRTATHSVGGSLAYPLGKGFSATASMTYATASANTAFEGGYRYHYSYAYYFAGVSWSSPKRS